MRRSGLIALILAFFLLPATARAQTNAPTFGAFTSDSPYHSNVYNIANLAYTLKRNVGIVNWYQNWGGGDWISRVQPSVMNAIVSSGRTPTLTWEPWDTERGAIQPKFRLRAIAQGGFDAYITKFASDLKAVGSVVYLRPMHEMNGNWYPWSGTINKGSAILFKKAWRRIVIKFRAAGATNVKFVWCPYVESYPATKANRLEAYFPGNAYVDVLALDGYNWGPDRPEAGGDRSFTKIFSGPYQRLRKLSKKPIWLAEVGVSHKSRSKARWVSDMWAKASTMPQLKAIVWFDIDKEEDWRAADGPAVTAAFEDRSLAGNLPPKPDPPLTVTAFSSRVREQVMAQKATLRPVPGQVPPRSAGHSPRGR